MDGFRRGKAEPPPNRPKIIEDLAARVAGFSSRLVEIANFGICNRKAWARSLLSERDERSARRNGHRSPPPLRRSSTREVPSTWGGRQCIRNKSPFSNTGHRCNCTLRGFFLSCSPSAISSFQKKPVRHWFTSIPHRNAQEKAKS